MGKGLALFGLILIILGIFPIIEALLGIDLITSYFYLIGIYSIELIGYQFSELMLILLGLGVVLLIVGAVK